MLSENHHYSLVTLNDRLFPGFAGVNDSKEIAFKPRNQSRRW
jgi:hypothetical protein